MKLLPVIVLAFGTLLNCASFAQENSPASGNVGTMATGAPAVTTGPTYGPWTNPNPGQSVSQCQPGEYAIGVQVVGASASVKYCIGCVSQLRVVCQRLP